MAEQKLRVLMLTVGTGNMDELRATLLEPLKKSIRKGEWERVVLLPSQITEGNALLLREEMQDEQIEILPLPRKGDENDADACFRHFDEVICKLRSEGYAYNEILADFTRGTKAMSAALVLAAIGHDLPVLRYVTGGQRDERGMVVPGTEIVLEMQTTMALARKRLDQAWRFFKHGNFAAALEILPAVKEQSMPILSHNLRETIAVIIPLAEFYSTWDRLDYKTAASKNLPARIPPLPEWKVFLPTGEMVEWVQRLAGPSPETNRDKALRLRFLIADLLANGERRIRDHQYEDAILRAYRVLELMGQIRLFDHDLDSAALPPEEPVVQKLLKELCKKESAAPGMNKQGFLEASRFQVARLLKIMADPFGKKLLDMGHSGLVAATTRNTSILIHGYEAVGLDDDQHLRDLYDKLQELIIEDGGAAAEERLLIARSLDFSRY